MPPIRHYYHCFAGGAWSPPVRDHLTALGRAGLDDMATTVGLIGSKHDCAMAREMFAYRSRKWVLPEPARWLEAREGHEQLTLQQIHNDVHNIPGDYAVLYAHAKGSYRDSDANSAWRRSMTARVVGQWEQCVEHLEKGFDAVGCHWVKAEDYREGEEFTGQPPFFAGNFWWARSSYLRTLPPPKSESRWDAELWLPSGNPQVYDMLPGWPDYS
jgi:hypothetical protein